MSQVVAPHAYCLENSVHLTRPGPEAFFRSDVSHAPTIIDKDQVKRVYRLQRIPYVNTSLTLDQSEMGYDEAGYFDDVLSKQIKESTSQPTKSVYHRPTDMSDGPMKKFSCGTARLDPQRIIPSETTTVRKHPAAMTMLRHDQGPLGEVVPRFTDRVVSDRAVRARIALGRSFNARTNENDLRNEETTDALARRYMYTSVQQAASNDVAWDSKVPAKVPVPTTTYDIDEHTSVFKSQSLPCFQDVRPYEALEWDRVQPRKSYLYRKPFNNVAPLPRAHQISGYSGVIGGDHIQDIDDPTVDFTPYTVVRAEYPKFIPDTIKPNIPFYTGKTHWSKFEPISHYDQSGHAYTTSAAFHKSLPIDQSPRRHTGLHGALSQAVTTVFPQNPYNQLNRSSTTVNASIDSRPCVILRPLPTKKFSSPKIARGEEEEEQIANN